LAPGVTCSNPDFPDREFMRDIAERDLSEALEFLD